MNLSVHNSDQLGETHLGWPSPLPDSTSQALLLFSDMFPSHVSCVAALVSSLLPVEKGRPRHPASSELNLTSGLTVSACFFFNNFKVFSKENPIINVLQVISQAFFSLCFLMYQKSQCKLFMTKGKNYTAIIK